MCVLTVKSKCIVMFIDNVGRSRCAGFWTGQRPTGCDWRRIYMRLIVFGGGQAQSLDGTERLGRVTSRDTDYAALQPNCISSCQQQQQQQQRTCCQAAMEHSCWMRSVNDRNTKCRYLSAMMHFGWMSQARVAVRDKKILTALVCCC